MKSPNDADIWDDEIVCDAHGVSLPCPLTPGCPAILRLTLDEWFTTQRLTER